MLPFCLAEDVFRIFTYTAKTGSTLTGVADCYLALSYVGCIKFYIIAFVLGVLYGNAERGSTLAIILYLLLLPEGLVAFTHATVGFSNALIMFGVFVVPGLVACSFGESRVVRAVSDCRIRIIGWN